MYNDGKDIICLSYNHLDFEVTRRCNLRCEHCMRGEPQDIDMTEKIVDLIFDQVNVCENYFIGGGEPLMNPDIIIYIINKIIDGNKPFVSFHFVTNGTILNSDTIRVCDAMNRLAEYCNKIKCGHAVVAISSDGYHDNDPDMAVHFFEQHLSKDIEIHKHLEGNEKGGNWVKALGRAKRLKNAVINNFPDLPDCCHRIKIDTDTAEVKCGVQICANGNVVLICEQEYMNDDRLSVGNILNEPLSDIFMRWNWTYPLKCSECDALNTIEIEVHMYPEDKSLNDLLADLQKYILLKNKKLIKNKMEYPDLIYDELSALTDAQLNIESNGLYGELWVMYGKTIGEEHDRYNERWRYNPAYEHLLIARLVSDKKDKIHLA